MDTDKRTEPPVREYEGLLEELQQVKEKNLLDLARLEAKHQRKLDEKEKEAAAYLDRIRNLESALKKLQKEKREQGKREVVEEGNKMTLDLSAIHKSSGKGVSGSASVICPYFHRFSDDQRSIHCSGCVKGSQMITFFRQKDMLRRYTAVRCKTRDWTKCRWAQMLNYLWEEKQKREEVQEQQSQK